MSGRRQARHLASGRNAPGLLAFPGRWGVSFLLSFWTFLSLPEILAGGTGTKEPWSETNPRPGWAVNQQTEVCSAGWDPTGQVHRARSGLVRRPRGLERGDSRDGRARRARAAAGRASRCKPWWADQ